MNTINNENFPIVLVTIAPVKEGENSDKYFDDYAALLNREEKFVMINISNSPNVKETKSNKEHIKKMNLWMKRHKDKLHTNVLAMIQIETDEVRRAEAIAFKDIFLKYWGHELIIVSDYEEALGIANNKLGRK